MYLAPSPPEQHTSSLQLSKLIICAGRCWTLKKCVVVAMLNYPTVFPLDYLPSLMQCWCRFLTGSRYNLGCLNHTKDRAGVVGDFSSMLQPNQLKSRKDYCALWQQRKKKATAYMYIYLYILGWTRAYTCTWLSDFEMTDLGFSGTLPGLVVFNMFQLSI